MPNDTLPLHPVTGLRALGYTSRGPVWPALGGSEDEGHPAGGSGKPADEAKFTQADLNTKIDSRLARERAEVLKKLGVDDLDAAVAGLADLAKREQATKTAEQQAADKVVAAEQRATAAEARANALERTQHGLEAGLPLALAKRLTTDPADEAAFKAEVAELLPFAKAAGGSEGDGENEGTGAEGKGKPAPTGTQGRQEGGGSTKLSTVASGEELYKQLHPQK